jgi:hypothetical protein
MRVPFEEGMVDATGDLQSAVFRMRLLVRQMRWSGRPDIEVQGRTIGRTDNKDIFLCVHAVHFC